MAASATAIFPARETAGLNYIEMATSQALFAA
jgi:hypothetical protein